MLESWSWPGYFNRIALRTDAVYQLGQHPLEVLSCEPGWHSKLEAIYVGHPGLELVDQTGGSLIRRCLNEGHMEPFAGDVQRLRTTVPNKEKVSAFNRSGRIHSHASLANDCSVFRTRFSVRVTL